MKSTIIICVTGCALAMALVPPARAALQLCMKASNCADNCNNSIYKFCCPTGQTGTEKTCPSGWSTGISNSTCSRNSTTGNDTKGYYTQNYGTCAPDISTYKCFAASSSSTAPDGTMCLSCFNPGI